jgi:diguanylate cyclase (GGDEF)-like protein/PAS domain S-box-containing protein
VEHSAASISSWAHEHRIKTLSGKLKWVRGEAVPEPQDDGGVLWNGILTDITAQKETEFELTESRRLLQEKEERLALAVMHNGIGIWDWNLGTREMVWDDSMFALYHLRREDFSGAVDAWAKSLHPDDRAHADREVQEALEGVKPFDTEFRVRWPNGEIHHIKAVAKVFRDEAGKPVRMLGTNIDITERKRMQDQIHNLAFHDSLTQLPNRRLLNDRLQQAMAANRRSGCYGALLFLDLDNFKPLNDAHGHNVGDLLLIEVADRLKACVREMDTVARFGGDEFVVMLSELVTDRAESTVQARNVAEKIRMALSEPYRLTVKHDGKTDATVTHRCTASLGVALFINHEASPDEVLKWADQAMYQAKHDARNSIRFHEPG